MPRKTEITDSVCDNTAIKLSFFFLRELPRDNVKIILEIPAMSKVQAFSPCDCEAK